MKRLLSFFLLTITIFNVRADHNAGGEVSWECISSGPDAGKYIFTLKLYRYCQGIGFLNTTNLQSTSPAGIITVNRTEINTIVPECYGGNSIDCYDPLNNDRAIDEHIYKSAPIALTGTPPSSGWEFFHNTCCRPDPAIYGWGFLTDNLHPQNQSYRIRGIMYKNSTVPGQCYDSSPKFIEKPAILFCKGSASYVSFKAMDAEDDSLVYQLIAPYISTGASVTYATNLNTNQVTPRANGGNFIVPAPGFSPQVPLPWSHVNMDILNQPLVLDPLTGYATFKSYTGGVYAMAIRVDAYRNGEKIASVMRDCAWQIISCASLPVSGLPNEAPEITFNSAKGSGFTTYYDTVIIGETVNFTVVARDSQRVTPAQWQTISLSSVGNQYGLAYSDKQNGCMNAECATLDTNLLAWNGNTWSDTLSVGTDFEWTTNCQHLLNFDSTYSSSRTYHFVFNAEDDYCDVPGKSSADAYITVIHDPSLSILTDSVLMISSSNLKLHWQQYTGTGFSKYYIHRSVNDPNNFTLLDSISSVSTTSYNDVSISGDTNYYYFISLSKGTSAACFDNKAYGNIDLKAKKLVPGQIDLSWNAPVLHDTNAIQYNIYRLNAANQFVIIDNVINTTHYIDSLLPCNDTIAYYIEAIRTGNHFTTSLPDTVELQNLFDTATFITSVYVDSLGNVTLHWDSTAGNQSGFESYIIKVASDSTGPYTALDTIYNADTGTYVHANAGANVNVLYYYIDIKGIADCTGRDTLSKRSNIVSTLTLTITNLNNGQLRLDWTRFYNKRTKSSTGKYHISRRYGSSAWKELDSTLIGNEQLTDTVVICNQNIFYRVYMDSLRSNLMVDNYTIIAGYEGKLEWVDNSKLIGPPHGINYQWFWDGNPIASPLDSNEYIPLSNGTYKLIMNLDNGCTVTTNEIVITTIDIEEESANPSLEIYPNPTNGKFEILLKSIEATSADIELMDNNGKQVFKKTIKPYIQNNFRERIDIHDLSKGIYLLKISVNGTIYTKKLVFQ